MCKIETLHALDGVDPQEPDHTHGCVCVWCEALVLSDGSLVPEECDDSTVLIPSFCVKHVSTLAEWTDVEQANGDGNP